MTKAVYKWNGEVEDDLVRSVMFWVLVIVPVYGFAMLGDAIVLNLIQFWTGETVDISSGTNADGTTYALVPSPDGSEAVLTVYRDEEPIAQTRFVKTSPGIFSVLDDQGQRVGFVKQNQEGGFELTDAEGHVVQTLTAEAILAL